MTRNFASVTLRVFRDRVIFSGGASSRFASSKCFRVEDATTRRRENVRVCPALYNPTVGAEGTVALVYNPTVGAEGTVAVVYCNQTVEKEWMVAVVLVLIQL